MPGCVRRGATVARRGTAHRDGSSRSETNWLKTSGSPRPRSSTCSRIASSVAKLVMSATGTRVPSTSLERRGLLELRLEEALAVDRRQHRLHDAAEPRRHATGQHDLRDLSTPKRVEPACARLVVAGVAGSRKRSQVALSRRLDRASDDVRLGRELARDDAGIAALRRAARRTRSARAERRSRDRRRSSAAANGRRERRRVRRAVHSDLGHDRRDSSAGVTSNAGFRAGKRLETSRGSRSSIGMSAPVSVLGSTVEVGATTWNGITWCEAATARP